MVAIVRELLPLVVLFYLLDALIWLRPGELAITFRPGGRRRGRGGVLYSAGLHPAVLSPAANLRRAHGFLLGATTEGVYWLRRRDASAARRHEPDAFGFRAHGSSPPPTAEGDRLDLGGGQVVKLPSPAAARRWAKLLTRLRAAATVAEKAEILDRDGRDRVALEALADRNRALHGPARRLARLCGALAAETFLLLPLVTLVPAAGRSIAGVSLGSPRLSDLLATVFWLIYAGTYAATLLAVIGLARRLRRLGHPPPPSVLLTALLFPPTTLHAAGLLGRDADADFDVLALAAFHLDRRTLRRLAAAELAGAAHALGCAADRSWRQLWQRRRNLVLDVLRQANLDEADVLAPPHRDPLAVSFCAACGGEFTAAGERCPECDLRLLPFPAAS